MSTTARTTPAVPRRVAVPLAGATVLVLAGVLAAGPATAAPAGHDDGTQAIMVDVAVSTLTVGPRPVAVGENVTYGVEVVNLLSEGVDGAVLTVDLDDQLAVVSMTPTQGTCDDLALSCDLGSLAADGVASVSVVARSTRTATDLTTSAAVSAPDTDVNPSNNQLTIISTVVADAYGCTIVGSGGPDNLVGTDGPDVICGRAGTDTLTGGGGDDDLRGGGAQDIFFGDAGDDVVTGGGGEDYLFGGAGDDDLAGGGGRDFIAYAYDPAAITLDLRAGTATDGWGGTDVLTSAGRVYGSGFDDVMYGSGSNDGLAGRGGDDHIYGRGGDDLLLGEDGIDEVTGGVGSDACDAEVELTCETEQTGAGDRLAHLMRSLPAAG